MNEKSIQSVSRPRGIASVNPFDGTTLRKFDPNSDEEIEQRLQRAAETFEQHRRTSFDDRAAKLTRVAEILECGKADLAKTMVLEMGKPIRAAIQEIEKCAWACRYFAEHAAEFLAIKEIATDAERSFVRHDPLGPVLAVMPWNFPFWQVFRFAAPAVMAGNVGLLKHASNVPQCALAIEHIFRDAGFAPGVFQTLLIGSERVRKIIEDPRISAVTLTGSVSAGSKVAEAAGRQIKKSVLELGGSDPFIVMPSAKLDNAVAAAVRARCINNGQSCIAAKRFIVDQKIADAFERRFVERMAALVIGNPLDERTEIGPLATLQVLESLEEQVDRTVQMGARVLLGGKRIQRDGFFFSPTVLTDIPAGSPAHRDELFGPVASVFRADGIEDAIRIANDTSFGLGSCIWTSADAERDLFVREIQSGVAVVNSIVASDPRLPFGGIKQSGFGRELSREGIREFVNIKTVSIH